MKRESLSEPLPYHPKVMLDSGAFSVWKRGGTVDLDAYIDYVKENREGVWEAVVLDQLPGKPGVTRTIAQVEEAAKYSWKNAILMRKRGIEPVPVFHQGEDFDWLKRYVEEGFELVGLSTNKRLAVSEKMKWLDSCFSYLCGGGGFPPVKLHAFGEGSPHLLRRYPWYSFDTTTWLICGGMGQIIVPPPDEDEGFDFAGAPFRVFVSEGIKGKSSPAAGAPGRDLRNMGKRERDHVVRFIESLGLTVEGLATNDRIRKRACLRYFSLLAKAVKQPPFHPRGVGLFDPAGSDGAGVASWKWEKGLKAIFVTSTSWPNLWLTTVERAEHILLSYYYLLEDSSWCKGFNLADFHADGMAHLKELRKGSRAYDEKEFEDLQ